MNEQLKPMPQAIPPYAYADEISLRDLVRSIGEQKWVLLGVWFAVVALAAIYLLTARPEYRAEVHLLPPLPEDIRILNAPERIAGGVIGFQVDEVYNDLLTNLRSRSLRLEYFRAGGLFETYAEVDGFRDELEAFDRGFNESLKIDVPVKGDTRFVSASFEFGDRERAVVLLDGFVALASQRTYDALQATLDGSVALRRQQLETSIAGKRQIAEVARQDRIAVLTEAHAVARELGIEDGVSGGQLAKSLEGGVAVNTAQMPLYTRGSRALGAEIAALEARESNDPYIGGLRDLQDQLATLNAMAVNGAQVRVARIDQTAYAPQKPVKPKRLLVALGALVAGLMLGLFAALLSAQLRKPDEREAAPV